MSNKTKSVARSITSISAQDRRALFDNATTRLKKKGLHIKGAPSPTSYGRMLIIIPKKVGNAVVRNKLRRRLRNAFYSNKLHERKIDLLLFVDKQVTQNSYQDLEALLIEAIS